MKRYGVMAGVATGVAALAAAGSVLLGTTQPSSAAVTQQPVKLTAAQSSTSITFVKRYFERKYPHGYLSNAVLPKTWREVHIGPHETRFDDTAHSRMIRFNTWWGPETPQSALKRKVAALKGTRGLHIVGTSTVGMPSTAGQGRLTVSTIVYTYKSGSTTRWVATRYVAQNGQKLADAEITVAGRPTDSKTLALVLNKATQTLVITP
ncbi:hypothetical protein GCM10009630_49730 [Kribbella jejuensis]|uniref:Polyketide cyclase/dehydrase/lipid transport protein n=1 Tax=Kribbella jejuensis TaxID=236068 RepID=A0A542E7Q4_9ACTN|nr:hypothetical protein [Kribbella jejuensis]TQJ11357.1 hypothetical protein FB475_4270 [Kribbella jejuensis]